VQYSSYFYKIYPLVEKQKKCAPGHYSGNICEEAMSKEVFLSFVYSW